MVSSKEQFVSRVKKNAETEVRSRRSIALPSWKSTLLKGFAWLTLILGVGAALGFFILMESVYSQLGGIANTEFASTLESSPQLRDLMASVGINWFPEFMKIYSIRFAIVLGVLTVTACIAFSLFSFSRNVKDKS